MSSHIMQALDLKVLASREKIDGEYVFTISPSLHELG